MKNCLILLCCVVGFTFSAFAQEEIPLPKDYTLNVTTLNSTITSYYEVLSAEKEGERDWELYNFLFHHNAQLIPTAIVKDTLFEARYITPKTYIESSSGWLTENGFLVKEIHRETQRFGNMANVFSTYQAKHSKTDTAPVLRGVNSFQMLYDGNRWWILNLYWSLEHKENPIPEAFLPKED
ncbi:hypothetical protein [Lacinutrix undariae]